MTANHGDATGAMLISVCIANYNGMACIDACIQSVRDQTVRCRIEIIVHDDCSTDGSADYIRARYPDVILIESPDNVGFCVANNRMAVRANGRYLLLLNNDAALFPDALECLLKATLAAGAPCIIGLPQHDWESGALLDMGSMLDPFFNPIPNLAPATPDVGLVAGACLWIPRALWQELDGFPEWFGSLGEDLHLCCRARLAGHRVIALNHSGYRHRVGASFGGGGTRGGRLSSTRRRRALTERNKTFVMVMCQPAPLLAILLPTHLALLYMEGMLLSAINRDGSLWREVYAPLLSQLHAYRNELKQGRRAAQTHRHTSLADWLRPIRWQLRKLKLLLRYGLPEVK